VVPAPTALADHLAAASGVAVHLFDCRLAPEAPYSAAVDDVLAAYRQLRETVGSVTAAGDSAGGG
jgi:acetyl esterase/lipase